MEVEDTEAVESFKEKIIEQEMMQEPENKVYTDLEAQDKLVEPDSAISGEHAVRNLQLGIFTPREFNENCDDANIAIDVLHIPWENGGWYLHQYAKKNWEKIDNRHIMSGSKGGKKWESLTQSKKVNVLETRKTSTNKMNLFKRQKQQ